MKKFPAPNFFNGVSKIIKLSLYLETTVFNYYFDEDREGHEDVIKLFDAIRAGEFETYTSDYVIRELRNAPEPKRSKMLALIDDYKIKSLDFNSKVIRLGELYMEKGIIPSSQRFDSMHVAMASVYEIDCIISYNFQHINRNKTKLLTASVNKEEGYGGTTIATAEEVLNHE